MTKDKKKTVVNKCNIKQPLTKKETDDIINR